MSGSITFKGNPLTLAGRALTVDAPAPDFVVTAQDLQEVRLQDFRDTIKVITSFLSIDTPVCDLQVKEFNKRAAGLSEKVTVIGMSMDLPFAQKRFCESFEIKNIRVVSDYKTASFGLNYGLLIKELRLLARAVVILDAKNTVRYIQIVGEATKHPDYEGALARLESVLKNPAPAAAVSAPLRCLSCEIGTPPLARGKVESLLAARSGWQLVDDKKIVREFKFKDFAGAKYFVDVIATIAEEQGHHPTVTLMYNKVKVTLTTHVSGGLTENDFIMAAIIDECAGDAV